LHPVEPIDPDRCLLVEFLRFLILAKVEILLLFVRLVPPDAISVVGLVV